MKGKKTHKISLNMPIVEEESLPPLHITLCHNCHFLNEGLSEVLRCRRCGTHLTHASYIEAMNTEELADLLMDEEELESYYSMNDKRQSKIIGLSVVW